MRLRSLIFLGALVAACGADETTSDDDDTSSTTGAGGSSTSATGSGASGGSGGSSPSGNCPTATLGSQLPISYDGTTVGADDLVTSPRLEWTDAGDSALLFVAPQAGTYRVGMPVGAPGCGASIREYGPNMNGMGDIYDASWCPAEGATVEIDGVFAASPSDLTTDVDLTTGQEMLVWVSCAYFATPTESAFQITIEHL